MLTSFVGHLSYLNVAEFVKKLLSALFALFETPLLVGAAPRHRFECSLIWHRCFIRGFLSNVADVYRRLVHELMMIQSMVRHRVFRRFCHFPYFYFFYCFFTLLSMLSFIYIAFNYAICFNSANINTPPTKI